MAPPHGNSTVAEPSPDASQPGGMNHSPPLAKLVSYRLPGWPGDAEVAIVDSHPPIVRGISNELTYTT